MKEIRGRVLIKEMSSDEPYEALIKGCFETCGEWFFHCRMDGETYYIAVRSVEWIKPNKAQVEPINKLAAVK